MSKSIADSAIFMEDSEAEVNVKIKKAFCPPGQVDGNPCLAYLKLLVFPWMGSFEVERSEANGGDKSAPSVQCCEVVVSFCGMWLPDLPGFDWDLTLLLEAACDPRVHWVPCAYLMWPMLHQFSVPAM